METPVSELFAAHGVRCTRQREVIYRALAGAMTHPTAEELHAMVRGGEAGEPAISLATVYNTLDICTRHGLVRKVQGSLECSRPAGNGAHPARYDADLTPHMHVVLEDGRLCDVPVELSEAILRRLGPEVMGEIETRMGVRVERVQMQLLARAAGKGTGPFSFPSLAGESVVSAGESGSPD